MRRLMFAVLFVLLCAPAFAQEPAAPVPPPVPPELLQRVLVARVQVATYQAVQAQAQKEIDALTAELQRAVQAATPAGYQFDGKQMQFVKVPEAEKK